MLFFRCRGKFQKFSQFIKEEVDLKSNYPSIALLAVLSKIIERHVYTSFYDYLSTKNVSYIMQSGFRPGFSCETALAHMVDIWNQDIGIGKLNGVVFSDLQKAFEMVDHEVLLYKLKLY